MITLAKMFFSFVKLRMQIFPKKILVSCDVTSLFTNISLEETTDIAINLTFNHNPNINITKKELKKLFLFAASKTCSQKFYLCVQFITVPNAFSRV